MKTERRILFFVIIITLLSLSGLIFIGSAAGSRPALKEGSTLNIVSRGGSKYVYGVPERLSVPVFRYNFSGSVSIRSSDNVILSDSGFVKTGDKAVDLTAGDTAIVIVTGDASGDGKITVTDYLRLKRHFLNTYNLTGVFLLAADVNGDGAVDATDYIGVKMHLLKTSIINSSFTIANIKDTTETTINYTLPFIPIK